MHFSANVAAISIVQDRWKEFEVGKNAILRLEEDSEQVAARARVGPLDTLW